MSILIFLIFMLVNIIISLFKRKKIILKLLIFILLMSYEALIFSNYFIETNVLLLNRSLMHYEITQKHIRTMSRKQIERYKKRFINKNYQKLIKNTIIKIDEKKISNENYLFIYSFGYDMDDDKGKFISLNPLYILIPFKDGDILIEKIKIGK